MFHQSGWVRMLTTQTVHKTWKVACLLGLCGTGSYTCASGSLWRVNIQGNFLAEMKWPPLPQYDQISVNMLLSCSFVRRSLGADK